MMKIALFLMLGIMILLGGCTGSPKISYQHGPTDVPITECAAVKIAKGVLPGDFKDTPAIVTYSTDNISPGTWHVQFGPRDIVFAELGWKGDAKNYYVKLELERALPEGVYGAVVIHVNAKTGEITKRELHNGYILGHPGMYADCDE